MFLPEKYLLCLFFIVLLYSCAPSTYNLENNIGLYKIIETECKLSEGLFNPCHDIKFMEIVKGQFYGIGPDQLALVSWHSETSGPDIEYTTNLISNHRKMFVEGNKIWLTNQHNDNESVKEFFIYESGQLTDYIFQFQRKNKEGKILLRNFHFKIFPTDRNKVKDFKLSYPDK